MPISFPLELLRKEKREESPATHGRICERLSATSRVAIEWKAKGRLRQAVGKCLDISKGGARIAVAEPIPVSTPVHVHFQDFDVKADAIVRHAGADYVGVEFRRLILTVADRYKPRRFVKEMANPLVIAGVLLFLTASILGLPDAVLGWMWLSNLFASRSVTVAPRYFSVGSRQAEVYAVQGPPTSRTGNVWYYSTSQVHFRDGRVVGWRSSPEAPLAVGVNRVDSPATARGYFTLGSSAEEVLAVQGAPTEMEGGVWRYGASEVYFRDGSVVAWKESPEDPLKAKRTENSGERGRPPNPLETRDVPSSDLSRGVTR